MRAEVCKHCQWYEPDTEHCVDDSDDIIPIIAVVQCGEADKIETKMQHHGQQITNKEVKHGKSKEEEVL